MSATHTHQGLPEGMKPFDLPDMLEKLRTRLGLRDEDITYIRYLLRRVRAADFQPGRICAVWEAAATQAADLGFNTRRTTRIATRLDPDCMARRLNPAWKAKEEAERLAKTGGQAAKEAVNLGNRAYKAKARELQDDYYEKVGLPAGLTRAGPKSGIMPGCVAVFQISHTDKPGQTSISFKITDYELARLNTAETDRQIVEALTGEQDVEASDMDL